MKAFLLGLALLGARTAAAAGAGLIVTTDPRFELLAVVHVLAMEEDPALTGLAIEGRPYADDIRRRFAPFRDHAAVETYRRARGRGLDFPVAFFFMLELGAPPELGGRPEQSTWNQVLGESFGGKEGIERFRAALSSFARESRFLDFYEDQRPSYLSLEEELLREMKGRDDVGLLERYTGLQATARYTWLVSPLSRGAATSKVVRGDTPEVYSLIGPRWWEGGEGTRFGFAQERYRLWHEMSHTLFDSLADEYADRILESETLFGPIADRCHGAWAQCLREHVAKGIARRLWGWAGEKRLTPLEDLPPAAAGDPLPYGAAMEGSLRIYEAERDRYPTLRDFYPRILDAFAELARSEAKTGRRSAVPRAVESTQTGPKQVQKPPPQSFFLGIAAAGEAAAARRLAAMRYREGDLDAALQGFLEAARLDPEDARAYLNGGLVLRVMGRRREAIKLVDKAVVLCSGADGKALLADALAIRGDLWVEEKRPDLGRKDFERALQSASASWVRRGEVGNQLRNLPR